MVRVGRYAASALPSGPTRRGLLTLAGAWAASLLLPAAPARGRRDVAAEAASREPWGRIEPIADRLWAVVSTPLHHDDWTTVCNGAIIAGSERVLVVESFARPAGAAWVAGRARELTGRRPTDVVITHYHGDHAGGLEGYDLRAERPRVWMTAATRELIRHSDAEKESEAAPVRREMLESARPVEPGGPTEIDLGGRTVSIHPRAGHTASDLTVELDQPSVVFWGDLLWNGLFPNFRDTTPTALAASVRAAWRKRPTLNVPGHGELPAAGDVERYFGLLEDIEAAARRAFESGTAPPDAAVAYRPPPSLGAWTLFSDRSFEVAIAAWHKELARR